MAGFILFLHATCE